MKAEIAEVKRKIIIIENELDEEKKNNNHAVDRSYLTALTNQLTALINQLTVLQEEKNKFIRPNQGIF